MENKSGRDLYTFKETGIDSKESISPPYVAWRAGTTNRAVAPARQATSGGIDS